MELRNKYITLVDLDSGKRYILPLVFLHIETKPVGPANTMYDIEVTGHLPRGNQVGKLLETMVQKRKAVDKSLPKSPNDNKLGRFID